MINLSKIEKPLKGEITITGSKSETNRLLILQKIFPVISIVNSSNSDDSVVLKKALEEEKELVDIGHAGTAMRFLTAYFATQENTEKILTGSHRMQHRPIGILVDALRSIGANIEYLDKEGFPPLKIKGTKLVGSTISIDGSVSSQYVSALLLIAPTLPQGLTIDFKGKITSKPYIEMTLQLLKEIGVKSQWKENGVKVFPSDIIAEKEMIVESDWSSASYFYSMVALQSHSSVTLETYKKNSLQGDAILAKIYKKLGVETIFQNNKILLKHITTPLQKLDLDLSNTPDIAQTIAVTCFGLGIPCVLKGLHTLKIKETDRLVALKNELEKLGGTVTITNDTLILEKRTRIIENVTIATYDDHRMAMAFAPLATKVPIRIENEEVVSKSYPDFWEDFLSLV
ncbi:MAG: 3-phosphoshikimate 1-carboxyvinyltransferase [Flavobacteriaceae bacterium]|nr:3-phosphoshikimate 1-carboxyvinyltransferase [Flavobacteriaceae bacterium]